MGKYPAHKVLSKAILQKWHVLHHIRHPLVQNFQECHKMFETHLCAGSEFIFFLFCMSLGHASDGFFSKSQVVLAGSCIWPLVSIAFNQMSSFAYVRTHLPSNVLGTKAL